MDEDKNPVRILLSTITLLGGAMFGGIMLLGGAMFLEIMLLVAGTVVLMLAIGISWLLFPKTLIVKKGGMTNWKIIKKIRS